MCTLIDNVAPVTTSVSADNFLILRFVVVVVELVAEKRGGLKNIIFCLEQKCFFFSKLCLISHAF